MKSLKIMCIKSNQIKTNYSEEGVARSVYMIIDKMKCYLHIINKDITIKKNASVFSCRAFSSSSTECVGSIMFVAAFQVPSRNHRIGTQGRYRPILTRLSLNIYSDIIYTYSVNKSSILFD